MLVGIEALSRIPILLLPPHADISLLWHGVVAVFTGELAAGSIATFIPDLLQ